MRVQLKIVVDDRHKVLGDLDVKRECPSVIATPDVFTYDLQGYSHFVLASDGLYDVCSDEEIITFIQERKGTRLNRIAHQLAKHAKQKGSMDDITVIIIEL